MIDCHGYDKRQEEREEKSIHKALYTISYKNENAVQFSINKAITTIKIDPKVSIY